MPKTTAILPFKKPNSNGSGGYTSLTQLLANTPKHYRSIQAVKRSGYWTAGVICHG